MFEKKKKSGRGLMLGVLVLLALGYFAVNTTLIKPSLGSRLGRLAVVYYLAPRFGADSTVEETRDSIENLSKVALLPVGTQVEKVFASGMKAEWIRARNVPKDSKKAVLYLHGGGFFSGSCNTHREMAARISKAGEAAVFLPEYRLAPESKFPAANEDCLDAYRWLLAQGYKPKDIAIGGDSAGGCLTLMTLITARDQGLPLPAAAFLISSLTDAIYFDGETYKTRAAIDPWFRPESVRNHIGRYTDNLTEKPLILSPINNDLSGLPPMLIQVGSDEILNSDSTRLAERARKAGVDVTLEEWDHMWHVFQSFAVVVPESRQAIAHIGKFLQERFM